MSTRSGQLPEWCERLRPGHPEVYVQLNAANGAPVRKYALSEKQSWTLGRTDQGVTKDIPLLGQHCSRTHAKVYISEAGDVQVEDMKAVTGTFMFIGAKQERLLPGRRYDWKPGVVLQFGYPDGERAALLVKESAKGLLVPRGIKRPLEADPAACAPPKEGAASERAPQSEPEGKRRQTGGGGGGSAVIGPALPPGMQRPQRREPSPPRGRNPKAGPTVSSNGASQTSSSSKDPKKCDKCDGPHPTDACPHFKGKGREDHKDAWANYGRKHPAQMGSNSGKFVLRRANMVRQPGDGSCLFHSLCFGLKRLGAARSNAHGLRRELANFIQRNSHLEIAGDTLEEWVRWDSRSTVSAYASKMAVGGWGGGIEMAACSLLHKVNVHVYEAKRHGEFHRISCFDFPQSTSRTIHVLYQGGMHYDAITC